jgi:hypothetical protein
MSRTSYAMREMGSTSARVVIPTSKSVACANGGERRRRRRRTLDELAMDL